MLGEFLLGGAVWFRFRGIGMLVYLSLFSMWTVDETGVVSG